MSLESLKKELTAKGSLKKAKASAWFFKTGPGQYGEGDVFIGLTVPEQREIAKRYIHLSLNDLTKLIKSKEHEFRFTALEILVFKYDKGDDKLRREIVSLYIKNAKHINNWDLVDTSAPYILGPHLLKGNKDILYKLAKSKNLWERRIAIVSTLYFIKNNQFKDTIRISEILLSDKEDLIHKATGWMLREVGKKDIKVLDKFLNKYCKIMPRTMLRYSIEKFDDKKREHYLNA